MPAPAALITQCLQNDFVAPVGRYDALPNLLHIGFEEARRLMGEIPDEGPVARVMRWAQQQPDAQLKLVHIRDWHDAADAAQQQHLQQFGTHCLKDTPGARFAFAESYAPHKAATIIDSPGLNDFLGTPLGDDLAAGIAARARIGVMGVWTEAKVSFLAYELRTRFPQAEIAVCSARAASASRNGHFLALQQLKNLLGIRIIDSVGGFVDFLGGELDEAPLQAAEGFQPKLEFASGLAPGDIDRQLIAYLFRDCVSVNARALSGGFSGNLVLACDSIDRERRRQMGRARIVPGEQPPDAARGENRRARSHRPRTRIVRKNRTGAGQRRAAHQRFRRLGRARRDQIPLCGHGRGCCQHLATALHGWPAASGNQPHTRYRVRRAARAALQCARARSGGSVRSLPIQHALGTTCA